MTNSNFSKLGLAEPIQRALNSRNHVVPTPIQARAIPELLAGRDMLGISQTGTGKTAAFALPILHQLSKKQGNTGPRGPRALILAPTRELAIQIGEEFGAYSQHLSLRHTVIFGGVNQKPQVAALYRGVDIVIATPGRLLDLMNQRRIKLDAVEFLVLDEADRMLDMGFVRDVRKIIAAVPGKRQSLMFSATMPGEIARLSGDILSDPVRVEVTPQATPIERIEQSIFHVEAAGKTDLLATILDDPALSRVLVFARTKHRANHVAEHLGKRGVNAEAIHGNKSQGRPPACPPTVPRRRRAGPGGDRYRGPRHRRRRRHPYHQLRAAQRAGKLCPSHRTDGAGRRRRGGVLVLRLDRVRLPARHRAPDPAPPDGGRGRTRLCGARPLGQYQAPPG